MSNNQICPNCIVCIWSNGSPVAANINTSLVTSQAPGPGICLLSPPVAATLTPAVAIVTRLFTMLQHKASGLVYSVERGIDCSVMHDALDAAGKAAQLRSLWPIRRTSRPQQRPSWAPVPCHHSAGAQSKLGLSTVLISAN